MLDIHHLSTYSRFLHLQVLLKLLVQIETKHEFNEMVRCDQSALML